MTSDSPAARLNRSCACEAPALRALQGFYSNVPVFVDAVQVRAMEQVIAAVAAVTSLPAYQEAVLGDAPAIARLSARTPGVFAGFDFHIGANGPQLIEINTNAGGAMINAAADWHHPDCCHEDPRLRRAASRELLERGFIAMFEHEWRLARGAAELKRIAIVDDEPTRQFLHPEFELFADLFRRHGYDAFIADAAELEMVAGRLRHQGRDIDLVYNRVTDFHLEESAHRALREAVASDAALVTPHPRAHALLADKRNLVRFTDAAFLRGIGASADDVDILQTHVPRTEHVAGCEQQWWQDRKRWFFKPARGFGSRGAYRGDKLTRRVFGDLMKGGYVAQAFAPPGERLRRDSDEPFKVDLRAYAYESRVQLLAARLYQGQTTNFRTAGGGFAPVMELL